MTIEKTSSIYFGYGSNMWFDQMARRCPESTYLGIAYLENWKWIICEKGYATLSKSPGDKVYGLVFKISETDEQVLDGYEEFPRNYVKEYHSVTFLGTADEPVEKAITAMVYIDVERQKESPPKTEYIYRMNMAMADAIHAGVPEDYMDKYLRAFIPRQ